MNEKTIEKARDFITGPASAKWVASLLLAVATGGATLAHNATDELARARAEADDWKARSRHCDDARLERLERRADAGATTPP